MDDLQILLEEFLTSLKVLNRSEVTIKELDRKLNKFFEYLSLQKIFSIDQITRNHIAGWQVEIYHHVNPKGRPNGIAHQNKMLAAVKQFFRFLKEREYIVADPAGSISYAKEPQTLPRNILTVSEARKIINAPDVKCIFGYRDRTILEILYSTGIRNKELCNLTLADVDYNDGLLRIIQGKGKKDRMVPLGKIACRYLENYIKLVRMEMINDPYNNFLFLTSHGRQMSSDALWSLVKKYARKAKIKKNVSPHTFRHSCATSMLKNKASIRAIQELLGHSLLNTTQVYTRVSITDLKAVHKQCHPREREKE